MLKKQEVCCLKNNLNDGTRFMIYLFFAAVAHAAAMGLEFPGGYHAAQYRPRTGKMASGSRPYSHDEHRWAAVEPMMAFYGENHPGVRSVDEGIHEQAHPRGSDPTFPLSRGTSNQVQSQYAADPAPWPPRGRPVINRKFNFQGVKHAAPSVLPAAPGQSSAASWDPQGQTQPGSFVHRDHDLVVDESAPNRLGVFWSGFSLPQSQGQGLYRRELTGYGLGREVAAPGSAGSAERDRILALSRSPALDWMRSIWVPSVNVQPFMQRYPIIRHVGAQVRSS